MDEPTNSDAPEVDDTVDDPTDAELVADGDEELLVEEVSIDGMCGVY